MRLEGWAEESDGGCAGGDGIGGVVGRGDVGGKGNSNGAGVGEEGSSIEGPEDGCNRGDGGISGYGGGFLEKMVDPERSGVELIV